MKRILLTGLSGVGKSTVTEELARRGYKAVDADTSEYSEWVEVNDDAATPGTPVEPGWDWIWRKDRIEALLANEDRDLLFLSGCSANMGQFLGRFDHIILLSAPPQVIATRLRTRTNNPYGQQPAEVARTLELKESVEPLLRRIATNEIDTAIDLQDVVAAVLRCAQIK